MGFAQKRQILTKCFYLYFIRFNEIYLNEQGKYTHAKTPNKVPIFALSLSSTPLNIFLFICYVTDLNNVSFLGRKKH